MLYISVARIASLRVESHLNMAEVRRQGKLLPSKPTNSTTYTEKTTAQGEMDFKEAKTTKAPNEGGELMHRHFSPKRLVLMMPQ